MQDVTLTHAKEHLEELIERAARGEDVRISDAKLGTVKLQPLRRQPDLLAPRVTDTMEPFVPLATKRVPGRLAGKIQVPARLMEPMSEEELHDWYGDDTGGSRLSPSALNAIELVESEVYFSIASAWEMAIEAGLGKWPEVVPLFADFETRLADEEFRLLPISMAHVRAAGSMQSAHRDPFDRLLAAQAMIEGLAIVTADPKLATLGARAIW